MMAFVSEDLCLMSNCSVEQCYVSLSIYRCAVLSPCHTKPRFHCVGTELFKFPEPVRRQANLDIFRGKGPIRPSLQRPWRCYRARMAFYRIPKEFLLAILCALTMLSRRSQCVHCAFTMSALPCICAIKIRVYLFCLNKPGACCINRH